MSVPDVSIIVPFYNRRSDVASCIESLMALQLDGKAVEIIAVDNSSSDGTREELARYPITVIDCETRGPAAARNAGINAASAPIIALTDSDCIVHPLWLTNLLKPFADPEIIAVGGRILTKQKDIGVACFSQFYKVLNQKRFMQGIGVFPPFFATANVAFRRDSVMVVGGFDERLWVGEDADLCWRMLDDGGGLAYSSDAIVYHRHRETFAGLYQQAVDYGAGSAELFAKHNHRLGFSYHVDWDGLIDLITVPWFAAWSLLTARHSFKRKWFLYEAVWLTGAAMGRWKGSMKHKTIYL